MEDQGKRLLLAVAVAFAIMLLWNVLFPPAKPEEKAPDDRPRAEEVARKGDGAGQSTTSAPAAASGVGTAATGGAVGSGPGTSAAGAPAGPRGPEQILVLESPQVRAEFSNWGGALTGWKLLGSQFHVPGQPDVPEDLVRLADREHRPFSIGFSDGSTYTIPAQAEWKGEKKSERELVFTWQSDDLSVEKRYRIHPENYLLELDVGLELKRGNAKQGLVVTLFSEQDPKTSKKGGWSQQPREWKAACYVGGEVESWDAKAVERVREEHGAVGWAGFLHSYFVFAMAPRAESGNLGCRAYAVTSAPGGMGVDLMFPLAQLEAGQGDRLQTGLVAYLGPKYLEKLEAVPAIVGVSPGFEKAVNLGFWAIIAGPLLWLMERFYSFVGSWGIAIILLTMTVKLATLYWTHKSMKSMKEMARLRPQLDKIREKYKDDRQKQQVETMNLFKAHGVNPLAGCLPMLLQMPIWFALYRALAVAAQLYQARFLWLADLTAPDPYFILPIFMTGTMLVQGRLTPTTGTGMQQKMMAYGMPAMFGAMSLYFPAGLTLYISTNTVLTLLHHLYMKRTGEDTGPVAKVKVAEAPTVSGRKAAAAAADAGGGKRSAGDKAEREDEGDADLAQVSGAEEGESGKGEVAVEPVRNGQRPRRPNRSNRPGRRGGRRKRSSRSS